MSDSYPAAPRDRQVGVTPQPASLADVLELVLDKGVVIAGDIKINLLEIELLTIKLRLLIASVDKAQEIGINWWQSDPALSSRAKALQEERDLLRERLDRIEARLADRVQEPVSNERTLDSGANGAP